MSRPLYKSSVLVLASSVLACVLYRVATAHLSKAWHRSPEVSQWGVLVRVRFRSVRLTD